jgi:hypothetical protein
MNKNQSFVESQRIKKNLWKHHIESWKKSGLSQAEYCRQHTLKAYVFGYWKKRFRSPQEPDYPSKMLPVKLISEAKSELAPDSSGISLSLDQRYTIHLAETFNSHTLSKLIDILENR